MIERFLDLKFHPKTMELIHLVNEVIGRLAALGYSPAKMTDSRYVEYKRKHGVDCWELDALDVQVIDQLITSKIIANRDEAIWEESVAIEDTHRATLVGCSKRWTEVVKFLSKPPRQKRTTKTKKKK